MIRLTAFILVINMLISRGVLIRRYSMKNFQAYVVCFYLSIYMYCFFVITFYLFLAAKFLHEHGVVLHYNDYLRGLNNLYFIDPSWLCDVIALIVTVREKNPFVRDGFIRSADVMHVLKDPRLPVDFIPQV